ncbi:hypothetical protein GCM10023323_06240 [Streptomyces thinghirensis]|uniref:Uncharacterized protein n=1 Tax=Streptomyces thinghirensis TaxID=551547 RepID=A0ABP9SYW0_9ACTN
MEPAGATDRASLVRPEWAGWGIDRDARLTLWVHSRCAGNKKSGSDLVFSVARSARHLSDDASCGVRGDSGARGQGCLIVLTGPSARGKDSAGVVPYPGGGA